LLECVQCDPKLAKALLEEATALFLNDDLVAQIHPITGDAGVLAVSASPVMPASARISAGVRPICVQDSLGDGPLVHRRHRRRRSVSSSRIRDGISPIRRGAVPKENNHTDRKARGSGDPHRNPLFALSELSAISDKAYRPTICAAAPVP
jgi:hypothetical protein